MVYQGRVGAAFARGSHASCGSAGPAKEWANRQRSVSGLRCSESARGHSKAAGEEPEGVKEPWGGKKG